MQNVAIEFSLATIAFNLTRLAGISLR
jgi:hypothetical protein